MSEFIIELSDICCHHANTFHRTTVYTKKFSAGKSTPICSLNVINPPPKHVKISSAAGQHLLFYIKGGPYKLELGVSTSGLPKLTARYAPGARVNSKFLDFACRKRWQEIDRPKEFCGVVTSPMDVGPARFIGALPLSTELTTHSKESAVEIGDALGV